MDSVLGLVRHTGNDGLFRAIEMSLLSTLSGQPFHVHAEGLRGTGKTTIMRAVRRVLPKIRRIKDCLYNCDPSCPHCPNHRRLSAEAVAALGEEWVRMPFLEVSHSAKVGTVIGSIDLGRLVSPTMPEAALLPGTIPQAHRGIIFIDEINRLAETAPELADVLLDVMGTKPGRVQIEETGLPAVELGVQVSVWAASNPDEDPGPLEEVRRQLSDRFDFVVYTDRPGEAGVVEQILAASEGAAWPRPHSPLDEVRSESFRTRVMAKTVGLKGVGMPQPLRQQVAELYSRYNLESLRAVQALQMGMRLAACLEGRTEATADDLARIAALALRHRVDAETMKKITAYLAGLNPRTEGVPAGAAAPPPRQRFPNLSFGGAAVQPLPEPDGSSAPAEKAGPPSDWPVQHPPRPAPPEQERRETWITRTLTGLRRQLGMVEPQSPGRPATRREGANGLTAPRTGRLFREADPSAGAGSQQQGGLRGDRTQGNEARGRGAGPAPGTGPGQVSDPLKTPPAAPPNPARPLSALAVAEIIRTEEELDRR